MVVYNLHWPIDLTDPANHLHPLNRGLVTWLLCLPGISGSNTIPDLSVSGWGGNFGVLTNGPVASPGPLRPGGWGSWDLDGTNDYIEMSSALKIRTEAGPFSVCMWIRPDFAPGAGGERTLFHWGAPTTVDPRIFLRHSAAGWLADSGGQGLGQTNTSLTWTQGDWFHIAYTNQNLPNTGQWYKNGVAVPTTSNGGTPVDAATLTVARIGRFLNADTRQLDSRVDDIRIYNRALSANEMNTLYNFSVNYYKGMLNRLQPAVRAAEVAAAAAANFRRTLSELGTRTGARQVQRS